MLEHRNGLDPPDAHLNLGIASVALGESDENIAARERPIDQYGEQGYPGVRYHLSRVRFKSGQDLPKP